MSSDIRSGDVVICVDDRANLGGKISDRQSQYIKASRYYRVIGIGFTKRGPGFSLQDVKSPADGFWYEARFRKIPPADEQFTQQMRACRPVRDLALLGTPPTLKQRKTAMLEELPALPATVSPGGREIWDWADRLSNEVHRRARIRELTAQIALFECGDCKRWMTRQCPKEVHDNRAGRSRGPSMKGLICGSFNECTSSLSIREKRRADLLATGPRP